MSDKFRIRFSRGRLTLSNSMDEFAAYRRRSVGWISDPPAYIHPRILFGSGGPTLTPQFVNAYNITHVINCAFQDDSPEWFKTSFPNNYACLVAVDLLRNPVRTTNNTINKPAIERTLVFIQSFITNLCL